MQSAEFKTYTVSEIQADKRWALNGGPFGSKLVSKDYIESGVPVIRGANLNGGRKLNLDNFVFVSEEKADSLLANNAHAGDVIFTQRGTLGQVGLIPDNTPYKRFVISQSQMKLTVNPDIADANYIYYLFSDSAVSKQLENQAFSSGVPHINLGILREFRILLPSIEVQKKVVEILSSYDDLIENNNRRIAILEEMAQSLYREWFINFRFPGHENTKFIGSPLGKIPEGWEVKNIAEISQYINRGIAPKYNDGCADKVINQKCIRNFRIDMSLARNHERKVPTEKSVQFGDVLINSTGVGTLGRVAQVLVKCSNVTVDTHVTIVRAMTGMPVEFWGCMLENLQDHFERLGEGATGQTELKRQLIGETKIVFPGARLAKEFSSLVMPGRNMIPVLLSKNENLKNQRDMLLPRLVSGNIKL